MINVFQPSLGVDEAEAVASVFTSNWLGHGQRTQEFESAFGEHLGVGAEHLMFISSATAGLFLAARLLDLGPGDDVVMPTISFVSAANAVADSGARPVFCDVDPHSLNPRVADVEQALTPRTRAVFLLHYGGHPGEVAAIAQLCRDRGVSLVEDAACAVASRSGGQACGTFGDIAMWSFDSMKTLVTGDGGMLYVRDAAMAERARYVAYHGLRRGSGFSSARVSGRWWELDVTEFGWRVLGNDVTAAIGCVQLAKLPSNIARRREVAQAYDRLLDGMAGVRLPPPLPERDENSHYFYWVQLDPAIRDQVAADLLDNDIYTTFRYPPLHKVPAYQSGGEFPDAEWAAESTLLLPMHQALTDSDVQQVCTTLSTSVTGRQAGDEARI
ncbi:DegT/DnrJ/EryC1/StrS family aminotransferase [Lipingzhangella sp. LS1_29]|uniref:DegT/DnrJ/EryC1/StrS family aminotransferase n=1 Tax=Lipingzhangella rawalii TaxID=2055835 RepID=A0ABU2H653_9ACTN|nr:DegT/DnrJ/EryC1/StrS family aminotransferase [Lipingzhangella rawalii]MDS1270791.1 DegT/DnrJ/EryC1/StrS family aminotransferase [Lipingzhangella rawalii]